MITVGELVDLYAGDFRQFGVYESDGYGGCTKGLVEIVNGNVNEIDPNWREFTVVNWRAIDGDVVTITAQ